MLNGIKNFINLLSIKKHDPAHKLAGNNGAMVKREHSQLWKVNVLLGDMRDSQPLIL